MVSNRVVPKMCMIASILLFHFDFQGCIQASNLGIRCIRLSSCIEENIVNQLQTTTECCVKQLIELRDQSRPQFASDWLLGSGCFKLKPSPMVLEFAITRGPGTCDLNIISYVRDAQKRWVLSYACLWTTLSPSQLHRRSFGAGKVYLIIWYIVP